MLDSPCVHSPRRRSLSSLAHPARSLMPAEVAQASLVPVLKGIRDEAAKHLRELIAEINP